MKKKWIELCGAKKEKVKRVVDQVDDEGVVVLQNFKNNPDESNHEKKLVDELKKKKQITVISNKSYKVTKGKNYAPVKQKLEATLTADMLRTGSYKDL